MLIKVMYVANVLVAGVISYLSLFQPKVAQATVFSADVAYSEVIRLVGALWAAIAVLSLLGLWFPRQMQLVFLLQLIYKGSWLLIVALPAILQNKPWPKGMAAFFLIWVLILPFVIPWSQLFGKA